MCDIGLREAPIFALAFHCRRVKLLFSNHFKTPVITGQYKPAGDMFPYLSEDIMEAEV